MGLTFRSGVIAVGVLLVATAGMVAAAGATEVRLSPEAETVDSGQTVTYDIVVGEASGGVGSYNVTVSTNDSAVASIQDMSASGRPVYTDQSGSSEARTLSVSGMDTIQSGPVTIATVTMEAHADGTAGFDISVTALGDEDGQAYTVANTQGHSLTVVGNSDNDDGGNDVGGSTDSGDSDADQTETPTPTATPTPTETASTPTPTGTSTATEMPGSTETLASTESMTETINSTATATTASTQSETSSFPVVPLAVVLALVAAVGGGLFIYRNDIGE